MLAFAAILLPMAVATLAHSVAKIPKIGNSLAKVLCVVTSYVTLLMILILTYVVVETGPVVDSILIMPLPIGNFALTIHVDGLALVPTILSALFASLAQTFSVKYLSPENRYRPVPPTFNRAYSLMLLFLGSMVGACFSGNMLAILIFWEITSLCSYALVAFWHEDPTCRAAALKTLIMTHVGTLGLLVGAITIYPVVKTWEIHSWNQNISMNPIVPLAMLLFFIGILPKAVQLPLHTWLPDATVAPTPVTAYVHVVGFLMGLYAFPRFFSQVFVSYMHSSMIPSQLTALFGNIGLWNFVISLTGAATLIIMPIFGLLESESKRLIAYCHISALGGTVMALGFGTPLGTAAGLFAMIPHVFFCGLLFLATGAAIYHVGQTSLQNMGGLSSKMPITAVLGSVGVLSWACFPFLGYFNAVWLIIHAALELNALFFIILFFFGTILKTAAILRMLYAIFFGKSPEYKKEITEAPALMLFPMVFLSACLFIFGAFPQLLLNYLVLPAVSQLGMSFELLSPLGDIITASGFWSPAWASVFALGLFLLLIFAVNYLAKERAVYRRVLTEEGVVYKRVVSEEAVKPFLCGEDAQLLDGARAYHFYHTLIHVLRIDRVCHASNVDRLYNALSKGFSNLCVKSLHLDIQQRYFPAILSFIVGTVVVILIAILAG
ncbi:MAG: F(420)H(2) dehydrogenase subunit L [Candidatus Bathyarchaeota archaeon BA1]|nr:MAG: F(420)H(2) dehydrogenase subunit L [Candidatus Bathyarchaeota archaeon BA1]